MGDKANNRTHVAGGLRLGIVAGPLGEARNAALLARSAEAAGFELLGLGDNQSLWRDVYVSLAFAAQATTSLRLGPCVTNVVTRHLAVTAGAAATVDEVSGGRAFVGLGPGDSAVLSAGERPARLAEVAAGVVAIRAMLSGDTVHGNGKSMHARWSRRALPIFVAAEGPRGLEMAGRVADGAFVSFGLTREHIDAGRAHIAAGAAEAGCSPDAVEVWHAARVTVADTRAKAIRRARGGMAAVAHHALRFPHRADVPAHLVQPLADLNQRYRTSEHAQAGDTFNAELVEGLGLMPYLTERYAIVGTAEDCAQRVSELVTCGVTRLLLMFSGEELAEQATAWRRDVMPLVAMAGRSR